MAEPTKTPSAPPTPAPKGHPDWNSDDARVLRLFLESDTGLRTLGWLKYWAPSLLDGSHVNKTLVASGKVAGYSEAVENIFSLTRENPIPDEQVTTTEYPDLNDNSKWSPEQDTRE